MANKDQVKKATAKAKKGGGAKEYFKGIKLEMSKVVWPTKKRIGIFYSCCNCDMRCIRTGILAD